MFAAWQFLAGLGSEQGRPRSAAPTVRTEWQ